MSVSSTPLFFQPENRTISFDEYEKIQRIKDAIVNLTAVQSSNQNNVNALKTYNQMFEDIEKSIFTPPKSQFKPEESIKSEEADTSRFVNSFKP